MAVRKPGDIAELETEKGLAHVQFIKKLPGYADLIRVIDGFFESRPTDIEQLAALPTRFLLLFPFSIAIHRGLIRLVGNAAIPVAHRKLPTFRSSLGDKMHPPTFWWLWDWEAGREWRVEQLTDEERRYPTTGVWNLKLLTDRIASGWKAEDEVF